MIAYNKVWLKNLYVREEADEAFELNCISAIEQDQIKAAYPSQFYTPNIFIRIGLFILTKIILSFSFGLMALVFLSAIEHYAEGLAIFFGVMAFAALEYMIKVKKHYQSGVDDALLWGSAIALYCGISFSNSMGDLENCILIFIISLLSVIRYTDRIMAAVCFISFLGIIFFSGTNTGGIMKAILPFIIMIVSLTVYIIVKKLDDKKTFNAYAGCFTVIEIISLLTLYVAGNYWVVRELSNSMFDLHLKPGQTIPFGFLFWIFTLSIPFIYIVRAVQKKDVIMLRAGLLLIAATVFTVRYYHAILLPEIAMLFAGVVMIVFAWALSRYLQVPKSGFTREEPLASHAMDKMQLESLLLAQTFSQQQSSEGTEFGGGSFGGGGASSDY